MNPALEAWQKKAPSKKELYRGLMADGRLHTQQELTRILGHRFGSVVFDAHNEVDVLGGFAPIHYERLFGEEDATRVLYRQVDKGACSVCSNPRHMRPSERIAALEKRVAELESENRALRAGR